ncbi:hypothetical protein [Burkholderia cenocepacia]|uniref:hypothetical protein n=1 Tax=Burkholderia cenocepacia TaxID=95486 RepID=UPI002AB73433|nr:hypothetical protein [Burkholderia cenocepacia]
MKSLDAAALAVAAPSLDAASTDACAASADADGADESSPPHEASKTKTASAAGLRRDVIVILDSGSMGRSGRLVTRCDEAVPGGKRRGTVRV